MKIELLVSRSGPSGTYNRGDVIEVNGEEAARMIEKGQAVPSRCDKKPETATPKRKYERAVKHSGSARDED
tara:strand:- start:1452 stop:1664 length:213 start_codon:yes stop_codon:yes gene_type:complete